MLKLTGGKKSPTRTSAPARKRPAASKPAATRKPAASKRPAKPAPAAAASTNGAQTRGPKLPEGWTKADFNAVVKDMQKARAAREAAAEKLTETQRAANAMALYLLGEGIQMSVVSVELELSRQWLYTLLEKFANGEIDENAQPVEDAPAPKRTAKRAAAKSKPAAKRTVAAKKPPARKRPAAKATPARKAPARKRPASAPAGRGRVRIAR